MQLTGKQIKESGILTNIRDEGVQQQGIDIRLKRIGKLRGVGHIPVEGKTGKPATEWIRPTLEGGQEAYMLEEGYYEVEFMEGCEIPNNCVLNFKTRSSLVRGGAEITSGQFDAGFKTDSMGAFLIIHRPIIIEVGARVAQAIITESYPVSKENLYHGQWQNDNQRSQCKMDAGDGLQSEADDWATSLKQAYAGCSDQFRHEFELLCLAGQRLSAIKALHDEIHCSLQEAHWLAGELFPVD